MSSRMRFGWWPRTGTANVWGYVVVMLLGDKTSLKWKLTFWVALSVLNNFRKKFIALHSLSINWLNYTKNNMFPSIFSFFFTFGISSALSRKISIQLTGVLNSIIVLFVRSFRLFICDGSVDIIMSLGTKRCVFDPGGENVRGWSGAWTI